MVISAKGYPRSRHRPLEEGLPFRSTSREAVVSMTHENIDTVLPPGLVSWLELSYPETSLVVGCYKAWKHFQDSCIKYR